MLTKGWIRALRWYWLIGVFLFTYGCSGDTTDENGVCPTRRYLLC